ncbi:MAG: T9SS type A sorting domain-containing protein [Saprospiraceae bacterium]
MKRLLYFFMISLATTFSLSAQTEVSGGIFVPTIWSVVGSPFIVTSDIVIFPNASLTIEPGVEVRFEPDTRIELREGDFYANGGQGDTIKFTINSDTPTTAGTWNGIENTTSTGMPIEVELDHVIFEYAKTAVNYGQGVAYRYISNAIFRNNERGVFDGALGYNWVTISDSEFKNNEIGMEGRMSALNCFFEGNTYGFANPHTFANFSEGARVTNCTFQDNNWCVASAGQIITIAIIENSTFLNNNSGFDGYWAVVDSCYFYDTYSSAIKLAKGEVKNSIFLENNVGIETYEYTSELSIHNNSITQGGVGLSIVDNQLEVFENTICDNDYQNVVLLTNQPVDLNNNCWCMTDLVEIGNTITDAYDDVALGIATYDDINIDCLGEDLVYPGDIDNNGIANAWDVLQLGLTHGSFGPVRTDAVTDWVGQDAMDWSVPVFSNGVNYKHGDADGNGEINDADLNSILNNYNETHTDLTSYEPVTNGVNTYNVYLEFPDTFIIGETVSVPVIMEGASQIADNLYGVAFGLQGSDTFFETGSFALNTSQTWIGNTSNTLALGKELADQNRLEVGVAKKSNSSFIGGDTLATLEFVMGEDIIVSLTESIITIEFANLVAITNDGTHIALSSDPQFINLANTTSTKNLTENSITIYPNPTSDRLWIKQNNQIIQAIEMRNMMGQVVKNWNGDIRELSVAEIESGVYFLEVRTQEASVVEKVVINN